MSQHPGGQSNSVVIMSIVKSIGWCVNQREHLKRCPLVPTVTPTSLVISEVYFPFNLFPYTELCTHPHHTPAVEECHILMFTPLQISVNGQIFVGPSLVRGGLVWKKLFGTRRLSLCGRSRRSGVCAGSTSPPLRLCQTGAAQNADYELVAW